MRTIFIIALSIVAIVTLWFAVAAPEPVRFPDTAGLELAALQPVACGGYFRAWVKPGGAYAVLIEYGIVQERDGEPVAIGDVVIAITYDTTTGDAEHVYVRRHPGEPVEVMTLDEVKAISAGPCDLLTAYLKRSA